MKKKLLLTVLIPTILGGCSTKNDFLVEESQNSSIIHETENPDLINKDDILDSSIEVNYIREIEGDRYTILNEERILISANEKLIIYNNNFDVVKELEEVNYVDTVGENAFIYSVPYYENGELGTVQGVMDFDGNILLEADPANRILSEDGESALWKFIDSLNNNENSIEESIEKVVTKSRWDKGENSAFYDTIACGLARIKVDEDNEFIEEIETLIEPNYTSIGDCTAGLTTPTRYYSELPEEDRYYYSDTDLSNIDSVVFGENGKFGIMGIDTNIILEPEYAEITYNSGYYNVINTSGKIGVFNPKSKKWIIEPSLPLNSIIEVTDSFLLVVPYDRNTISSIVYNDNGELLKEFDGYRANIYNITDISMDALIEENLSEELVEVKIQKSGGVLHSYVANSNFDLLDYEFYSEMSLCNLYSIEDKLLLNQTESSWDIISTNGEFVTSLPKSRTGTIGETPLFINGKFLLLDNVLYEISGLDK